MANGSKRFPAHEVEGWGLGSLVGGLALSLEESAASPPSSAKGQRAEVVVVAGATATGKSALATTIAAGVGGEVVNADAFQIYRGLDIGTGKPTSAERGAVAHHLFDCFDPSDSCSAGRYAELATEVIQAVIDRGKVAVVCGGSGLYLLALFFGLAPIPSIPAEVRLALRERLAGEGLSSLRRELETSDPVAAARVHPSDTQRTLRALEIVEATGRSQADWQLEAVPPIGANWRSRWLGLRLPRHELRRLIELRVTAMLELGWEAEVAGLLAAGVPEDAPAFRALGYRELIQARSLAVPRDQLVSRIAAQTRQYAKRQETWFRGVPGIHWIEKHGASCAVADILKALCLEGGSDSSLGADGSCWPSPTDRPQSIPG